MHHAQIIPATPEPVTSHTVTRLLGAACFACAALPAHAVPFEAFASVSWSLTGVSAAPVSDPFDLVILGLSGAQSGSDAVDNFFSGTDAIDTDHVLTVTNPKAEAVFATLSFDYMLELYFGSDGLWNDPLPGVYDVEMIAAIDVTPGKGSTRPLDSLVIEQILSCPSATCSDRYRTATPFFGPFVDLELAAGETVDITLGTRAIARAAPASPPAAAIPLPASVPLLLTGVGMLVALRRRTRRAA